MNRSPADPVLEQFAASPRADRLRELAAFRRTPLWLVGGFVRDALLGRPPHRDIDLAIEGDPRAAAEAWSRLARGTLVPLDPDRGTWRVVSKTDRGAWCWDFNRVRGDGIEGDLRLRDFTVNALALPLWPAADSLLDPTGGVADLASGTIRHAGAAAFAEDPLRRLRALRFAGTLGFSLHPPTRDLLRGPDLVGIVSGERIREELGALLATDHSAGMVRELGESGALASLWPPAGPDPERLARLESMLAAMPTEHPLRGALAVSLTHGLTGSVLLKLGSLLLPPGCGPGEHLHEAHALVARIEATLGLGRRAAAFVDDVLEASAEAAADDPRGTPETPWEFLDARGEAGLGGLALLAALRPGDPGVIAVMEEMARFHRDRYLPERAEPPILPSGEAARLAGIEPGPALGRLVRDLRMARRIGTVTNSAEAEEFVREWAGHRP